MELEEVSTEKVWDRCVIALNNIWVEPETGARFDYKNEDFLLAIWNVSTKFLPGLEVSVIVDKDDNLFCSYGSPGYVDYSIPPEGMKIPIKCWIHTHPFGSAYWSRTDWNTIHIWKSIMEYAIVLGGDNQMHWYKIGQQEYCQYVPSPEPVDSSEHVGTG